MSNEVERAVLGAMLLNADAVAPTLARVGSSDRFVDERHGPIFEAISRLSADGRPVDIVTLIERLTASGNLAQAGGAAYVAMLQDAVPTSHHVAEYAARVVEAHTGRLLAAAAARFLHRAKSGAIDSEALDAFHSEIGACFEEAVPASALPVLTDMRGAWDMADEPIPCVFREGVFMRGNVVLLASEAGLGKSIFALVMALSVGLFRSFLAGFTPERPGRAMLLLGEDGPHPTAQRIRAWCESAGVTRAQYEATCDNGNLSFLCGESAALVASDFNGLRPTAAYLDLLEKGRDYDLIVVDTLAEWLPVANENDNSAMHFVGKLLVDLARDTGACVVVLHHSNKQADKSGATGLHAVRGGSGLTGKVREAFMLSRLSAEENRLFKVDDRDTWRYVRFHDIKGNYRPGNSLPVYFERKHGGVLEVAKLVAPTEHERLLPLAQALAQAIGENRPNTSKWDLIQKKPGADFRAKLKIDNPDATVKNIGLAYDVAVAKGLIYEEEVTCPSGGNGATIPRQTVAEDDDHE